VPDGTFLVSKINEQVTVIRQCQKAKRMGISEGSALSLALAFLPNATIRDFDPIFDFKALYKLCAWTYRYTPLNGMDFEIIEAYKKKLLSKIDRRHYGINLDITGTERVNKGEYNLIKNIHEKMGRARFEARLAIGPTLGAAWAFSRYLPEKIYISKGELSSELKTLPVDALRLNVNASEALKEVGIKNIGTLLSLSRKSIAKRYGSRTIQRIDQAFGEEPESIHPIPMPNHWAVYREFDYPISEHEQIVDLTLEMLGELIKKLLNKGRKARYFVLFIQGEDLWGIPYRMQKDFSILIASSNDSHVKTVLFPFIEKLALPGPIYLMGLSTKDTEKIEPMQTDIDGNSHRKTEKSELLNRLANEVGANNVKEVRFSNSFLPEESFIFTPAGQSLKSELFDSHLRGRPSKLLEIPEEISAMAMLPDSPPIKIIWKGENLKVLKGFGPERITTPWFQCEPQELISRDYYKIEDEKGRWLWIYRNTLSLKWFLQGLWV